MNCTQYIIVLLSTGVVGLIHGIYGITFFTGMSVLLVPLILWLYEKAESKHSPKATFSKKKDFNNN